MKKLEFSIATRLWLIALLLTSFSGFAIGQGGTDACHVYLVDVKGAEKAYQSLSPNATAADQAKALSSVMKILGEFPAKVGEEELTTKSYPFPDSKLVITASVFYTDESMPADSITLAIAVADKALKDALQASNNAVAEVNYSDSTKIVRVRKYLEVNGRTYLIGLQCNNKPGSK
ncbi:MAG: hypothetical protein QOJ64_911 [Acidobacteriota bacterium]|jgi:hypothetical protein|nr:hypothetical protein [Acidobacteriota bacterium]